MKKGLKTGAVILTVLLLAVFAEAGGTLSASDAANLEQAGFPVYPGARKYLGKKDTKTGEWLAYSFATSDKPDDVMNWYRKKLPEWSVSQKVEGVLYKGEPGAGVWDIPLYTNMSITEKKELPEWFSDVLEKGMTTKISIARSLKELHK